MGKRVMDSDIPVFARWATFAAKDIGAIGSYKKRIFVLTGENCSYTLPCCAIAVKAVVIGDHGCDCESTIFNTIYNTAIVNNQDEVNVAFGVDVDVAGFSCSATAHNWYIQDGCIVFDPGVLPSGSITVQLLVVDEDEEGFIMASENSTEAITRYILYRYAARSRFSKDKMDITDKRDLFQEYIDLRADARATDAYPDEEEKAEIAAMLNDPLVGWGYSVHTSAKYLP